MRCKLKKTDLLEKSIFVSKDLDYKCSVQIIDSHFIALALQVNILTWKINIQQHDL